jgi:GxxExxY protein
MVHELRKRGLNVEFEKPVAVKWDDVVLDVGFRLDLIVEEKVVIELKSIESVLPVHRKTLLTYLRLTNRRLGLLVNFSEELIKDGISRVVNGLPE